MYKCHGPDTPWTLTPYPHLLTTVHVISTSAAVGEEFHLASSDLGQLPSNPCNRISSD